MATFPPPPPPPPPTPDVMFRITGFSRKNKKLDPNEPCIGIAENSELG